MRRGWLMDLLFSRWAMGLDTKKLLISMNQMWRTRRVVDIVYTN